MSEYDAQIAGLSRKRHEFASFRFDFEGAFAFNGEAHLVVDVVMLFVELRKDRVDVWRLWLQGDEIGSDVAAVIHQLVDLRSAGSESCLPRNSSRAIAPLPGAARSVLRAKSTIM